MNALLIHGWAYDADFWKCWIDYLSTYFNCEAADRGYFYKKSQTTATAPKLIICHSLGLHWLKPHHFKNDPFLVIIGGFSSFLPEQLLEKKIALKTLGLMKNQLKNDPFKLLKDFYENCAAPNIPDYDVPLEYNTGLLLSDLNYLAKNAAEVPRLFPGTKTLILHGEADRIVRPGKAEELHKMMPHSKLTWLAGTGHVIPKMKIDECCRHIMREFSFANVS